MGWMQLLNAIVGHLLSWPVFGIVAVVVFRRQLTALIHRITSYEGLGQKLTFGQELAKAEEEVDNIAMSHPEEISPSDEESASDGRADHYVALAEQAPAGAILESWVRIEKAIVVLAETYDTGGPGKSKASGRLPRWTTTPPVRIIAQLAELQVIPRAMLRVIDRLRRLRNEVAHGRHDPTVGEAITYVATAQEVWEILERLASLASKDDQGGADTSVA